jgi:hypothetical protein
MPRFDENLRYAHDCDWYYRYILKYGKVAFIREHTIVNFLWENSVTSTVTQELIFKENRYILEKYK